MNVKGARRSVGGRKKSNKVGNRNTKKGKGPTLNIPDSQMRNFFRDGSMTSIQQINLNSPPVQEDYIEHNESQGIFNINLDQKTQ